MKVAMMSLEEKSLLTAGSGTMTMRVPGCEREWQMSDSSHTVRAEMERWGWGHVKADDKATVLPTLSALAATWNRELAEDFGHVVGEEARARGKDQMLGPGINLMRTPLCGRNWEYMSEDPCLTAKMVVPEIKALQSHDVAATVKHFCLNGQELNRMKVDTICDERTLNELYLPAFEAAIVEAGALCVMTAYNKVNGDWCSENAMLQRDILRDRYGFKGMIVTDWGGQHSTVKAALSGGGVEMNRGSAIKWNVNPKKGTYPLAEAVEDGSVPEWILDEMAERALYVMDETKFFEPEERDKGSINTPEHRAVALAVAEEAMILFKNDEGVLPLSKANTKKLVVVGSLADTEMTRKGSSAEGNPPYEITPLAGLKEYLGAVDLVYIPRLGDFRPADAEGADAVLVFTGTELGVGRAMESEGGDRPNMKLPLGHDEAIETILSWKLTNLVVVTHSGSPLELPWAEKASTILHEPYIGQEAGRAFARVLFGEANPSGKLPCTWPKIYSDTAVAQRGTYGKKRSELKEGVFIGYRWHDAENIPPLFPFGHGLSYTTFEYGGMTVEEDPDEDGGYIVSLPVTNTGSVAGKEVVQLYVAPVNPKVPRPPKELKDFVKLSLEPGETKTAVLRLKERDFAHWDIETHDWLVDGGGYRLLAGSSSADIRQEAAIE